METIRCITAVVGPSASGRTVLSEHIKEIKQFAYYKDDFTDADLKNDRFIEALEKKQPILINTTDMKLLAQLRDDIDVVLSLNTESMPTFELTFDVCVKRSMFAEHKEKQFSFLVCWPGLREEIRLYDGKYLEVQTKEIFTKASRDVLIRNMCDFEEKVSIMKGTSLEYIQQQIDELYPDVEGTYLCLYMCSRKCRCFYLMKDIQRLFFSVHYELLNEPGIYRHHTSEINIKEGMRNLILVVKDSRIVYMENISKYIKYNAIKESEHLPTPTPLEIYPDTLEAYFKSKIAISEMHKYVQMSMYPESVAEIILELAKHYKPEEFNVLYEGKPLESDGLNIVHSRRIGHAEWCRVI
jgi:hypothetical protein